MIDGKPMPVDPLGLTTLESITALPSVTYKRRLDLPGGPGLYFVLIDSLEVAYIGISKVSICGRWIQHPIKYSLGDLERVTIAYAECDDIDLLKRAERHVIGQVQPELNFHYIPNALARQHARQAVERAARAAE